MRPLLLIALVLVASSLLGRLVNNAILSTAQNINAVILAAEVRK